MSQNFGVIESLMIKQEKFRVNCCLKIIEVRKQENDTAHSIGYKILHFLLKELVRVEPSRFWRKKS